MTGPRNRRFALAATACALLLPVAACAQKVLLPDRQSFTRGPYTAFAQPWGAGALKQGVDFIDTIELTPATFPNGTLIRWHWPLTPPKGPGVYGYDAIDFGDYYNTTAEKPIAARQIKTLGQLTVSFDLEFQASAGDANILAEFFPTAAKGGNSRHIAEVGFFLHTPQPTADFMSRSQPIGTFVDRFRHSWEAVKTDQYIMFAPVGRGDLLAGTIDFKGALDFLRAHKLLTGEEWFNGGALGIEPITGSGVLKVKALSFAL